MTWWFVRWSKQGRKQGLGMDMKAVCSSAVLTLGAVDCCYVYADPIPPVAILHSSLFSDSCALSGWEI